MWHILRPKTHSENKYDTCCDETPKPKEYMDDLY